MDSFVRNLIKKLSIAFNTTSEALDFFCIGDGVIKPDEFLFGIQFFMNGKHFAEAYVLFDRLDSN